MNLPEQQDPDGPWVDDLYRVVRGPIASVRQCLLCKHYELYRYTGGHRGAGFVGGNKARGRIIQHIKSSHPVEYAQGIANRRAWKAQQQRTSVPQTDAP